MSASSSQPYRKPNTIRRVEQQEVEIPPGMVLFGPIYMDKSDAEINKRAKDFALEHILQISGEDTNRIYKSNVEVIDQQAIGRYDFDPPDKCPNLEMFRQMMVRDGCFFLQLVLQIVGGGDLLKYPQNHMYFGKFADCTVFIPHMFFTGNQIPYCVIRVLMKINFFQAVMKMGTWRCPPKTDLPKLALYLTVVEPELEQKSSYPHDFSDREPPNDILHALHNLFSGSAGRDYHPIFQLNEFRDLEASSRDEIEFPSAVELKDLGIKLRPTKEPEITKILFRDLGYCAKLYLPALRIDHHTKHILTSLAIYEETLHESHREVMAYLRFILDLVRTGEDFKILRENKIIEIKDEYDIKFMPDDLPTIKRSKFTTNFLKIRGQITDYERQPRFLIRTIITSCTVITAIVGISSIVGSLFTILAYYRPPK